jgi:hypothetical protein
VWVKDGSGPNGKGCLFAAPQNFAEQHVNCGCTAKLGSLVCIPSDPLRGSSNLLVIGVHRPSPRGWLRLEAAGPAASISVTGQVAGAATLVVRRSPRSIVTLLADQAVRARSKVAGWVLLAEGSGLARRLARREPLGLSLARKSLRTAVGSVVAVTAALGAVLLGRHVNTGTRSILRGGRGRRVSVNWGRRGGSCRGGFSG